MNRWMQLGCLLVATIPIATIWGQGSDVIEPRQGRDIRCQITGTTPLGVQYQISGQNQEISILNLKGVRFAGEPTEISRAKTRLQGGQLDDALTELQKINVGSLNDYLKAEVAYVNALALARKALPDGSIPLRDAATAVSQFLQTYPTSYHIHEMTEIFAWMAYHAGEFSAAERSFQSLIDSELAPLAVAGHYGLARAAIEQSKWDDAARQLDAASAVDAIDDQSNELKLVARALSARVLAEQDQIPQAIEQLETIIRSESDERTRVFANVYNALGVCHLKAGALKPALRAFLHTDLLYANESDPHAEALFYLADIWSRLNETDRSNRARQTLGRQYRNSLWATRK